MFTVTVSMDQTNIPVCYSATFKCRRKVTLSEQLCLKKGRFNRILYTCSLSNQGDREKIHYFPWDMLNHSQRQSKKPACLTHTLGNYITRRILLLCSYSLILPINHTFPALSVDPHSRSHAARRTTYRISGHLWLNRRISANSALLSYMH